MSVCERKKRAFGDLVPPGFPLSARQECRWAALIILMAALPNIRFFTQLAVYREWLSESGAASLEEAYRIGLPAFKELLGGSLSGFLVILLLWLVLAGAHFMYFRNESHSIYTMKRLPARGELMLRTLAMPVLFTVVSVLLGLLLMAADAAAYRDMISRLPA